MSTTHSNIDFTAIDFSYPQPPTQQEIQNLVDQISELLSIDKAQAEAQAKRRLEILKLAEAYLSATGKTYVGKPNVYYIGPDVTNEKLIYVRGQNANLPIKQMEADGRRTSLRRPRVKRTMQKQTTEPNPFEL